MVLVDQWAEWVEWVEWEAAFPAFQVSIVRISYITNFDHHAFTSGGMGGGASGGPWLQKYNAATKEGQQVSLTSFSYSLAPGKVHGPHFNTDNIGSLFQENQNA